MISWTRAASKIPFEDNDPVTSYFSTALSCPNWPSQYGRTEGPALGLRSVRLNYIPRLIHEGIKAVKLQDQVGCIC
jgi:hypothetical protein